jgi:GNAT superfamily N-acetyltransferase
MEIQRLTSDEAVRLRTLRLRALRDAPDAFDSTFEESFARTPESWATQLSELATFVAVIDGSDAGIARGGPDSRIQNVAWLLSMWVAPEARGQGVGEALVDAVVGWARSNGMVRLLLDVGDDNTAAVALYARKGFSPNGKQSTLLPPRDHIREHQRVLELL